MKDVVFVYDYYQETKKDIPEFLIIKTFVGGDAEENTFSSKLINHQELKEAAIKWFEENFTEKTTGKYGYVDHFNYYFVEIKILEGFDSKKLNCPARSEWKVVPNLYPSNSPFQVQEEMG